MSQVEKRLNHVELEAFKNYDSNNYALIPGINSDKQWVNPYQKKNYERREVNERLNKSGMSRDIQAIAFNKSIVNGTSIPNIKQNNLEPQGNGADEIKRHISISRQEKEGNIDFEQHEKRDLNAKSVNASPRVHNKNNSFTVDVRLKGFAAGLHSKRLANYLQHNVHSYYQKFKYI